MLFIQYADLFFMPISRQNRVSPNVLACFSVVLVSNEVLAYFYLFCVLIIEHNELN